MLELDVAQLYQWIGQYFFPLCRISAFFMVLPIFSTQLVPMRIRMGLAVATTVVIAPVIAPTPAQELLSLASILIILQIFVIGGQAVAMQNGLGFATLVDPVNGVNVASISQLYLMTVNLLFFAMNGHLAVIQLIGSSFTHLPVAGSGIAMENYYELVHLGSWMFTGALLVALPSTISLLVVNIAFGVISRVAPQMNIIAVGFPFTMILGLVIIWLTLANVLPQYEMLSDEAFTLMSDILK
ncbi:MAG: flagellar biosynthetic protein FliR [Pseudomonadota bacterium]